MSHETDPVLDPGGFAARLDDAFGEEPPHAALREDLAAGRRRLRRRRACTSLAALATVGVVAAGASVAGTVFPDPDRHVAPAAGGAVTAREMRDACLATDNVLAQLPPEQSGAERLLGDARVLTSAVAGQQGVATLAGEDGSRWGECQVRIGPDGIRDAYLNVYPTDVRLARTTVAGVRAWERPSDMSAEGSLRLKGTATSPLVQFAVTCTGTAPEETQGRRDQDAACPQFVMTWNDRRPAEVSAVKVTTPDGVTSWADVEDGYVSFAHVGDMTSTMSAAVSRGEVVSPTRVVFYDADGRVLVDDRRPADPVEGVLSVLDFPSLAWWLR